MFRLHDFRFSHLETNHVFKSPVFVCSKCKEELYLDVHQLKKIPLSMLRGCKGGKHVTWRFTILCTIYSGSY